MAKINRYGGNLEAFASEAIGQERTVFGTETFDDSLTAQINALFRRGWGIVAPASMRPTLQDFNALGYDHYPGAGISAPDGRLPNGMLRRNITRALWSLRWPESTG